MWRLEELNGISFVLLIAEEEIFGPMLAVIEDETMPCASRTTQSID